MSDEKAAYIANCIAEWMRQHLITRLGIEPKQARYASINAANKAAQSLQQDLREPDDAA